MWSEDDIARCGVLALLLEVSACPKPGNVSRRHDFEDTKYEHFLASAVSLFPVFRHAAHLGITGETSGNIGKLVKKGVEESTRWQSGGNTHFGSILLFIPLSMSAGRCATEFKEEQERKGEQSERRKEQGQDEQSEQNEQKHGESGEAWCGEEMPERKRIMACLRRNAIEIMRGSTVEDAVQLYEAFRSVNVRVQPVNDLDVRDPSSVNEIVKRGLTLHDVLSISASYDTVSAELVGGFARTFKYASLILEMIETSRQNPTAPRFGDLKSDAERKDAEKYACRGVRSVGSGKSEGSRRKHPLSDVISCAYLQLLASEEDTFVRVKFGEKKSRYVRERAEELVKKGFPIEEIENYDDELIAQGINPGTSADIIAASVFVSLLCGLKI